MYSHLDWAAVVPLANEENDFSGLIKSFENVLQSIGSGVVYFVVDHVSTDKTHALCQELSSRDSRFRTIWAPENKNVVDAYIRGLREAVEANHEYVIEMDGGLSHDPRAIPMFLRVLTEGNECAFGSRYINGGSMADSPFSRRFLSRGGTLAAQLLLSSRLHDMTSGFQAFHRSVLVRLLKYKLHSQGHFYQTELRHLLRDTRWIEVPIHYRAPSPHVSRKSIRNSIKVLLYYFRLRLQGHSPSV